MRENAENKCCLVLEGGGVKCSYQYGVLKTLVAYYGSVQEAVETLCSRAPENAGLLPEGSGGVDQTAADALVSSVSSAIKNPPVFNGVAGSSFGALNSAMLLADGMDKLESFWENISAESIFHEPRLQTVMEKIYHRQKVFDLQTVVFALSSGLDPLAKQREISQLYYDFILRNVDEEAVRGCGLELGITAVELANFELDDAAMNKLLGPDKLKTLPVDIKPEDIRLLPNYSKFVSKRLRELYLEDIPEGLLPSFVAASAAFPAFKPMRVGDTYYTDGGVLDNIPIKMMERRGFTSALCIRTGRGEPQKRWSKDMRVTFITPSRELGAAAIFSVDNVRETIALGEYDAKKFLIGG